MNLRLVTFLALFTLSYPLAAAPQCSNEAVEQARKLLAFHSGEGDLISVEGQARELPPIKSPADSKQTFAVLEVLGHIYKGEYRMRLIYYRMKKDCVLVGQEILEHARL